MNRSLLVLLASAWGVACMADVVVGTPRTPHGVVTLPPWTNTYLPFVIMRAGFSSMRYQQVYSASLFTNVPAECIYITRLGYNYYPDTNCPPDFRDWKMMVQLNLSTTQSAVDGLSTNFAENVGSNDTVVFGPVQRVFPFDTTKTLFDQPFRYHPAQGNLLLDVRVWDATGTYTYPPDPRCILAPLNCVCLSGVDSPTDEVSRIWATNVLAAVATDADTTGLFSVFQFTQVPALQI